MRISTGAGLGSMILPEPPQDCSSLELGLL